MTPGPREPLPVTDVDECTFWAIAARTGDQVAAAAFVRSTQADVWRFVAALVDPVVAEDLTQETYVRVFRALPSFEARSSARTWLFSIARRTCADHIRQDARRRRLLHLAAAGNAADAVIADHSATVGAVELLGRLGRDRREAFVATQVLRLSYAEAAEVLGVPIGTIRSRVARARADLVAMIEHALAC